MATKVTEERTELTLRVLFYQEGAFWVAQCVDLDVAAHGNSLRGAEEAFEWAFVAHLVTFLENKRDPIKQARKPPVRFEQAFERAVALQDKFRVRLPPGVTIPDAHVIGAVAEGRIADWN